MKKTISTLLMVAMLLGMMAICVSAAEIPENSPALEITVDFVNCAPTDTFTLTLKDLSWAGAAWASYTGETVTWSASESGTAKDFYLPKKDVSWAFGGDYANYWDVQVPEGYTVTPEFIDGDGNDPAVKGHAKFTVTGLGSGSSDTSSNAILKGTPTVDGKLDEIYLQSYKTSVDTTSAIWIPKASDDEVATDVYFLHDGEYLYVCAVVTGDSAVVDTGLNDWVGDSVEIWFRADELHDGKVKYSKVPMGAYGNALPNGAIGTFDNLMGLDFTTSKVAATQQENGYVVEMKLATPYYSAAKDSIAINVQLNNVYSADTNGNNIGSKEGGFYGSQATNSDPAIITLSSQAVTAPEPPKTGDAISLIVALLAASSMGIAVISKKKEF